MAIAEHETGFYSEMQAICKSFGCTVGVKSLPPSVYMTFINYITSPDQCFISAILEQPKAEVEEPLRILFGYAGAHRILLKHCVYEEARSCREPNQIMRRNNAKVRIPLEFVKQQLSGLLPMINTLKLALTRRPSFRLDDPSEENIEKIRGTFLLFLNSLLELGTVLPSSVRFVCKCVFDSFTFFQGDPALGHRAVFMLFIFRVLFPMLTQTQPTDPPELKLDPLEMAQFPKLVTNMFVAERQLSAPIAALCTELRGRIGEIYATVTRCVEAGDVIPRPSHAAAVEAVDKIRALCAPNAHELAYAPPRPLAIVVAWLTTLANDAQ
jgi:hypothetical protein